MLVAAILQASTGAGCGETELGAPCLSEQLPKLCEARGGAAAGCWSAGTICSTVVRCPDGTDRACSEPGRQVDCGSGQCIPLPAASACSDPSLPVYCPDAANVPASCWSSGTVCSTIARCPDGTLQACSEPGQHVDCATKTCVLKPEMSPCETKRSHPVFCPAFGGVPALCWSAGTVCSTVSRCSDGSYQACTDANRQVDCVSASCIAGTRRARGVCIEEAGGTAKRSYSCCPNTIKEECLAGGRLRSFVPDVGLEYCRAHGYNEECGSCCRKSVC